jgi:hypothetical protein
VCAAVLDARVCELELVSPCIGYTAGGVAYVECGKLDVGVLVPYALLQRAHGIFRLHRLGANHVGYLEVEGHVFSAGRQYSMAQLAVYAFSPYKLEDVARSICSSNALFVEDPNQPAMVSGGL